MRVLALGLCLAGAHAFAPSGLMPGARMPLRAVSAARKVAVAPKMAMDVNSLADGAQALMAAVPNVPFVDEITGEPQGFTAPLTHFGSVRTALNFQAPTSSSPFYDSKL
jgi:hypothetical protein